VVEAMASIDGSGDTLPATAGGYGKRTPIDEYRVQYRGGYGIINIQASERNGDVVGVTQAQDDNQVMVITQQGKVIRMAVGPLRRIGRNTQGVRLIRLDDADRVKALARLDIAEDVAAVVDDDGVVDAPIDDAAVDEAAGDTAVTDDTADEDAAADDRSAGDDAANDEDPATDE